MGATLEIFQIRASSRKERYQKASKIRVRGAAMEEAESLIIQAAIPSGPVVVSKGR